MSASDPLPAQALKWNSDQKGLYTLPVRSLGGGPADHERLISDNSDGARTAAGKIGSGKQDLYLGGLRIGARRDAEQPAVHTREREALNADQGSVVPNHPIEGADKRLVDGELP